MGKVIADETEKGWYIQWVDRDPRLLAMQEAAARREKADLDDEEKQVRYLLNTKSGFVRVCRDFLPIDNSVNNTLSQIRFLFDGSIYGRP